MVATNNANRRRKGQGKRRTGGGGDEIVSRAKDGIAGAVDYLREQARAAAGRAKETATEVSQALLATVADEAERAYDKQKGRVTARVAGVSKIAKQTAHALHAVKADAVAEYVEEASRRVADARGYLEEQTLTQMLQDAGQVVRRNPGAAVGGLFVAGFVLTRFLRASASRGADGQRSWDEADDADDEAEDDSADEFAQDEADEGDEAGEEDADQAEDEGDAEEEDDGSDEDDDADAEDAVGSDDDSDESDEGEADEDESSDDDDEEAADEPSSRRGRSSGKSAQGRGRTR